MSYDVGLYIDTGASESTEIIGFNYTYNCSPMFYKALDGGINSLDGKSAVNVGYITGRAVVYFGEHREELENQGMSIKDIATEVGLSYSGVYMKTYRKKEVADGKKN